MDYYWLAHKITVNVIEQRCIGNAFSKCNHNAIPAFVSDMTRLTQKQHGLLFAEDSGTSLSGHLCLEEPLYLGNKLQTQSLGLFNFSVIGTALKQQQLSVPWVSSHRGSTVLHEASVGKKMRAFSDVFCNISVWRTAWWWWITSDDTEGKSYDRERIKGI
jgi:hypothetical protein